MTVVDFKHPKQPGQEQPNNTPKYPPMFNIPPLTLRAMVAMVGIYTFFAFTPSDMIPGLAYNLAFVARRYTDAAAFNIWAFISPFTHMFMHGGWMHVAMNALMFLAFGAACERMMGSKRAAALFILCGLVGAATQMALAPTSPIPMIGASGALSGLFAAVIIRMQESGAMPVGRFGIWSIAAFWIGLSLFTAWIGGSIGIGDVAWAAHAGGFLAGIGFMRLDYFK